MHVLLLFAASLLTTTPDTLGDPALARAIRENNDFNFVQQRAREVVGGGFNAGDSYGEVWIRDYNTFIGLSMELFDPAVIEEQLLVFFRLQGADGNIVDGFVPRATASPTSLPTTPATRIPWRPITKAPWCRRCTST